MLALPGQFLNMKKALFTIFFAALALLGAAQSFSFECICGEFMEGDRCDICTSSLTARKMYGILILQDSVPFKWIDEPYSIKVIGAQVEFKELLPGGETVRINLIGTAFDSMPQFQDSLVCPCAGGSGGVYFAGPGITIVGDTVAATGWTISDGVLYDNIISDTVTVLGSGLAEIQFNDTTHTITIYVPPADSVYYQILRDDGADMAQQASINFIATTDIDFNLSDDTPGGETEIRGDIQADAVDNSELANMANGTFKTRFSAGTGDPEDGTFGAGLTLSGGGVLSADDASATNEIQTLSASGAGPSYDVDLSLSGGNVTFTPGADIALSRSGNEITISFVGSAPIDSNGIYTGSNTVPSNVTATITDRLRFLKALDNSGGFAPIEIEISNALSNEPDFLKFKFNSDSLLVGYGDQEFTMHGPGDLTFNMGARIGVYSDSVTINTQPSKTTLKSITGNGSSGYLHKLVGTTTGQVPQWNNSSSQWELATISSGSITGAENGLSVVSNKVRWGGTLITTTQINQSGNEVRFYGGGGVTISDWSAFANAAVQTVRLEGLEASPTTATSPTKDGIAEFRLHNASGSDQSNSLTVGGYANDADGIWLQSRSYSNPSFEYPLSVQPRGGQWSLGRTGGLDALATIHGAPATGSGIGGSLLHLENILESGSNGKACLSFGAGTDILDSEISWWDGDDALRIVNRSTTDGFSAIRFSIGGETSDRVIFLKTSATSLTRAGFGYSSTTGIHSTLQSSGSLAAACLNTAGSPTFDETKFYVVYTGSGSQTYTLPSASSVTGRMFWIANHSSSGTITFSTNIKKAASSSFTTLSPGEFAIFSSDGLDFRGFKQTSL